MSHLLRALIVALGLALAAPAGAASAQDRAAAEVLFREARTLMSKQKYAVACRKLEESQRLDPQGGTLLNLAVCHAREGRTASAWVEFQESIELARQAKREDRVKLARRELAQLDGKIARLTVEVPPEARVKGLEIRRGDEVVGEGGFGTAVPVDPGVEIELKASAAGYKPWSTRLSLRPVEQKTVVVPKLEKLPPAPPPPPPKDPSAQAKREAEKSRKSKRIVAYAVGGAGIVAVGIGSYFGLRALSMKGQAEDHCDGSLCDPEGLDKNEKADRAATVANVAFGIGVVALGVGTYFFVISEPERGKPAPGDAPLAARATLGPAGGSVRVSGRW